MKHLVSECLDAQFHHDFGKLRLGRSDAIAQSIGYSYPSRAHGEESDNLAFSL
jgi:hypothetical protein